MITLLRKRRCLVEAIHGFFIAFALLGAFLLRFDFELIDPDRLLLWRALPVVLAVQLSVLMMFQVKHLSWRHFGLADLLRLVVAVSASCAASTVVIRIWLGPQFPRSVYMIDYLLCLSMMTAARVLARARIGGRRPAAETRCKRILIYGAGTMAVSVLRQITEKLNGSYRVLGFVDDDRNKRNLRIHGVRVLGTGFELPELVPRHGVDEVVIAIASANGRQVTRILSRCHAAGVRCKIIPAIAELIDDPSLARQIRDVNLEDLLGRPPVKLSEAEIRTKLTGRAVMVTGAGGSIGSELCRQIARFAPRALIAFDNAETALYNIEQEIRGRFPALVFHPEVGSIQNRCRLDEVLAHHSPAVIYHAAAYKHVPMMEHHIFEAIENNILGTSNVARAAAEYGVEDFVLISSDKAVRPTNVMGATKRAAELLCLSVKSWGTKYVAVRFGNVLGSNGSVIPLFQKQIAAGGPVTVTHSEMRRYFMTIPEAAQLVLQASAMGQGGEIFVLDMGEPIKIVDLARNLILLSGFRPDEDVRIIFTGVRPGEKLYEELSTLEEDTLPTRHPQIRIFAGKGYSPEEVERFLDLFQQVCAARDTASLILSLKEMVPDYSPSTHVLRQIVQDNRRQWIPPEPVMTV